MSKFAYFYYILLWVMVCLGVFTINAFTEITYIKVINSDLDQIVMFGEANLMKEDAYTIVQYLPNTNPSLTINNLTLPKYAISKI